MTATPKISSIHIHNYRHLKNATISGLRDVNIFIGPNNAGKTSIIEAVRRVVAGAPVTTLGLTPISKYLSLSEFHANTRTAVLEALQNCTIGAHRDKVFLWGPYGTLQRFGKKRAAAQGWLERDDFGAFDLISGSERRRTVSDIVQWGIVAQAIDNWCKDSYFLLHRRKSKYEEQYRASESLHPEAEDLVSRIANLNNAIYEFRERLYQFINGIVPGLGKPVVTTDPKTQTMRLECNGRSLNELGGGVEQAFALAAVLLGEPGKGGIFIEEPESHLHPEAQRALIGQLLEHKGERQIFLTTHSPVFINEFDCDVNVYSVIRTSNGASIEPCIHKAHQRTVLDMLGVQPSTLLQTNCVVWIEGPTESILIRYWLSLVDDELREHKHYELAYTGGSLRTYLDTASGPDGEPRDDYRDIFEICRHNFIICDRDADPAEHPRKSDVLRFKELESEHPDHLRVWVTDAYEIEWYYVPEIVSAVWSKEVADELFRKRRRYRGPFYDVLKSTKMPGTQSSDKVPRARSAVAHSRRAENPGKVWFSGKWGPQLEGHLRALAAFIRKANRLPVGDN